MPLRNAYGVDRGGNKSKIEKQKLYMAISKCISSPKIIG
jgi:hypothetical protein